MTSFNNPASAERFARCTDWLTCVKAVDAVAKAAGEGERMARMVDIVVRGCLSCGVRGGVLVAKDEFDFENAGGRNLLEF